jgi:hypothetical protein
MSSAPLNQHLESSSQLHINSVGGGADSPLGPVLMIDNLIVRVSFSLAGSGTSFAANYFAPVSLLSQFQSKH